MFTVSIISELTFDEYEAHARSTAYFLDVPDQETRWRTVTFGFREEANELLTDSHYPAELRTILWGRSVEPELQQQLQAAKTSEAGDILYYISAVGMLKGIPLRVIGAEAIRLYAGTETKTNETFAALDRATLDRMAANVGDTYRPHYAEMQMCNMRPFDESRSDPGTFAPCRGVNHGPVYLTPDGLYVLERLTRDFSEEITLRDDDYINAAALLLGGLSCVLQNRLDSSLSGAARQNIAKRDRRAAAGSLSTGDDAERSRAADTARPQLSGWKLTLLNLAFRRPADNL